MMGIIVLYSFSNDELIYFHVAAGLMQNIKFCDQGC